MSTFLGGVSAGQGCILSVCDEAVLGEAVTVVCMVVTLGCEWQARVMEVACSREATNTV